MTKHLSFFTPSTSGLWIQHLFKDLGKPLWITWMNERDIYESKQSIDAFNPDIPVHTYPQWDTLPYASASPSGHVQMQRQLVLDTLSQPSKQPHVILSSTLGLLQKVAPNANRLNRICIQIGEEINLSDLSKNLLGRGFLKTEVVYTKGQFCIRGGIIDVFPEESQSPYRIDLFGDEVESIHTFNPSTQLRNPDKRFTKLEISSHSEIILTPELTQQFEYNYAQHIPAAAKSYYHKNILAGTPPKGWEQLYPLFFDQVLPLPQLLENVSFIIPEKTEITDTLNDLESSYQYRQQLWTSNTPDEQSLPPIQPSLMYCTHFNQELSNLHNVYIHTPFTRHNSAVCGVKTPPALSGNTLQDRLENAQNHAIKTKKKLVISFAEKSNLNRIKPFVSRANITSNWDQTLTSQTPTTLWESALVHGIETESHLIYTSAEIIGERRKNFKKITSSIKPEDIIAQASQLNTGDLVIHRQHGLGRYLGLKSIDVFNASHDCLFLEYANQDKLYLPVENIELLSRYGSGDQSVSLDKIGGSAWQARQAKVKKQLKTIAKYLMNIAAKRHLKTAPKIHINEGEYSEFCQGFPFVETDDQLAAINDVIADLSSGKAMDRLICGDVGFGKTEVALRAAFATANSGLQVVIVAPTTILARQHHATFSTRFKNSNIPVFQVSRLVTPATLKLLQEYLTTNKPCVIIGTHVLLGPKYQFNNLGLLVVDEEQMFGVKQKEKIKELSENVHILTLSATPIPRTLQLSLLGIKDMSLIATPPIDRRSIQTTICEEDPIVISQAIEREIARSGQVFYVCPRVADIAQLEEKLKSKFPKLKTTLAHGQLPPSEIEKQLIDFIEHKTDILLSTQIIESGIDIPNANTMIVHNAHLFGLSQLYQLRGRIGRSNKQAFVYFILPEDRSITVSATKRLQVMSTLDTLGAGFTLASHDLDIRGAGNLLGEEQSGHIKDVGVELYQDMLKQAISILRKSSEHTTEEEEDVWSPILSLGLSVALPEQYISDINLRMETYQKLGKITSEDGINNARRELLDRFGALPTEAENLIDTLNIKVLCRKAHIQKVESGPGGVLLTFRRDECPYGNKLIQLVQTNLNYKIRPDSKLFYKWSIHDIPKRVEQIHSICSKLANMAH